MTAFDNLKLPSEEGNSFVSIAGEEWRAVGWGPTSNQRKLVLNTDAFLVEIVEHGRLVQWNKHLFLTRHLCADAYGEAPFIEEAARTALTHTIRSEECNGLLWFEHAIDLATNQSCWVAALDTFMRAQVMRCNTGFFEAHVEVMGIREFFGNKHIVTVEHLESSKRFTSFEDAAKECIELAARTRSRKNHSSNQEESPSNVVPLLTRKR